MAPFPLPGLRAKHGSFSRKRSNCVLGTANLDGRSSPNTHEVLESMYTYLELVSFFTPSTSHLKSIYEHIILYLEDFIFRLFVRCPLFADNDKPEKKSLSWAELMRFLFLVLPGAYIDAQQRERTIWSSEYDNGSIFWSAFKSTALIYYRGI